MARMQSFPGHYQNRSLVNTMPDWKQLSESLSFSCQRKLFNYFPLSCHLVLTPKGSVKLMSCFQFHPRRISISGNNGNICTIIGEKSGQTWMVWKLLTGMKVFIYQQVPILPDDTKKKNDFHSGSRINKENKSKPNPRRNPLPLFKKWFWF